MAEIGFRVCGSIPGQSLIDGDETIEKLALIERLEREATPGLSEGFGVIPIAYDLQQRFAEGCMVPGRHQESRVFVLHILNEASVRAGHDGCAPHHRFSRRVSECLRAARGYYLHPGGIQTAFDCLAWLVSEKVDIRAKLSCDPAQSATLRSLASNHQLRLGQMLNYKLEGI
jgi:hypothetical protein